MDGKEGGRSVGMMDFADVLLPGDDLFPSARGSEMALLLLARLEQGGLLDRLEAAVQAAGGPLGAHDPEQQRGIVARVKTEQPELFEDVLKAVYLTYYEQPAVIEAIRAMGFAYNMTPLPEGYATEPFDLARDAPRHGRGRWIRAEDVVRVDLSGLDYVARTGA